MQIHPNDCGVYAIAFLTDICYGRSPSSCIYDHKKIRSHLINCFQTGKMTPFPSTETKEEKAMLKTLNVYRQCRLPNVLEHKLKKPIAEEVPCMVQCYICDNFYHNTCVNVTKRQAKTSILKRKCGFVTTGNVKSTSGMCLILIQINICG